MEVANGMHGVLALDVYTCKRIVEKLDPAHDRRVAEAVTQLIDAPVEAFPIVLGEVLEELPAALASFVRGTFGSDAADAALWRTDETRRSGDGLWFAADRGANAAL